MWITTIVDVITKYADNHDVDCIISLDRGCVCYTDDMAPCIDVNVINNSVLACVAAKKIECSRCESAKHCWTIDGYCYVKSDHSKTVADIIKECLADTANPKVRNDLFACACNVDSIGLCEGIDIYNCYINNRR